MTRTEILILVAGAAAIVLTASAAPSEEPDAAAVRARCEAGGGCVLITKQQMGAAMDYAYGKGVEAVRKRLDSNGCLQGST